MSCLVTTGSVTTPNPSGRPRGSRRPSIRDRRCRRRGCGTDGRTWNSPGITFERLGRLNEGGHAGITRLASIDNAVWACGMGRVAMRREANGKWVDQSAPKSPIAKGITASPAWPRCRGRADRSWWRGEIWVRSKNAWLQEDSPTSSNFNNVSVGVDGEAVIVGDKGGLVVGGRGSGLRWIVALISIYRASAIRTRHLRMLGL